MYESEITGKSVESRSYCGRDSGDYPVLRRISAGGKQSGVLAKFWRICVSIGQDHSFCHENAERLKDISLLALGDTIYFFVGNVIFLLLNLSHPSIFLASLVVEFVGFAVCIAAAADGRCAL